MDGNIIFIQIHIRDARIDFLGLRGGPTFGKSFAPKLLEFADEDDDVVDTEAPDEAETDVRILLDFLSVTPETDDEGQWGFSRHSSGLNDEKSARIPLSVT